MQEFKLLTGRGGRLPGRLWIGERDPQGVIVVVHGLGDHSARYQSLADDVTRRNWALLAFDLPGHGASPGRRGGADSFDGLLADIGCALSDAGTRLGELPQVLLGHSMGGNLAINYALRRHQITPSGRNLDGLVLAAPMLLPPTPPPRPHIFAAWLTGHLLPRLRVHRPVDVDRLTRDPAQAAAIATDPQMHASITVYLATQLLSQGRWAIDHARDLAVPLLLMFGESDDLIDRAACEHLPIRVGGSATVVRWPEKRHAIFHDQPDGEVSDCLVQWLSRLEASDRRSDRWGDNVLPDVDP